MGKLVLAAKVTHVPSLMLSEVAGSPLKSARENAVRALRELGRRARDRRVSTFVVFDTHWLSNFGYHINANPLHRGSFTRSYEGFWVTRRDQAAWFTGASRTSMPSLN